MWPEEPIDYAGRAREGELKEALENWEQQNQGMYDRVTNPNKPKQELPQGQFLPDPELEDLSQGVDYFDIDDNIWSHYGYEYSKELEKTRQNWLHKRLRPDWWDDVIEVEDWRDPVDAILGVSANTFDFFVPVTGREVAFELLTLGAAKKISMSRKLGKFALKKGISDAFVKSKESLEQALYQIKQQVKQTRVPAFAMATGDDLGEVVPGLVSRPLPGSKHVSGMVPKISGKFNRKVFTKTTLDPDLDRDKQLEEDLTKKEKLSDLSLQKNEEIIKNEKTSIINFLNINFSIETISNELICS